MYIPPDMYISYFACIYLCFRKLSVSFKLFIRSSKLCLLFSSIVLLKKISNVSRLSFIFDSPLFSVRIRVHNMIRVCL